ncbi:MAG: hypothetical protein L0211_06775 [Planctomycetaceae bacterium]|nr:hypothetical protein [Planctomycetaceae bacterium]
MLPRDTPSSDKIPLWLKILATAYVAVLVPAYWYHYGFADSVLWFSSLGLLITTAALWLESPRLASMQLVSIFLLEMMWIVDYLGRLLFDVQLVGIAEYMFNGEKPLYVRGLSLRLALAFVLLFLHRRGKKHQLGLRPEPKAANAGSSGRLPGGADGRAAPMHLLANAPGAAGCDATFARGRPLIPLSHQFT